MYSLEDMRMYWSNTIVDHARYGICKVKNINECDDGEYEFRLELLDKTIKYDQDTTNIAPFWPRTGCYTVTYKGYTLLTILALREEKQWKKSASNNGYFFRVPNPLEVSLIGHADSIQLYRAYLDIIHRNDYDEDTIQKIMKRAKVLGAAIDINFGVAIHTYATHPVLYYHTLPVGILQGGKVKLYHKYDYLYELLSQSVEHIEVFTSADL